MSQDTDQLRGKTIVITGASSGFGRGSAIRLAYLGANVVGAARRTEVLNELQTEVEYKGGKIHTVSCDVSNADDIQQLYDETLERFGTIDIWINNVGVGALGYFWDIPLVDHARLIDVNFKGLVYGSHVAMRHFINNGHGILINVGSIDSEVPLALQNTYAATKAAVLSLTRTLHEELKLSDHEDIRLATIMPWAVDTPWWNHAANYTGRKPRMTSMDDPKIVIEKIVEACVNPKLEMTVGPKAGASKLFHQIFPGLTERMSGTIAKKESEKAAPMPHHSGSIHAPNMGGTTVEGNIRARMKKEDRNA